MDKPKILIIDDDPDLVESMQITLEANDYQVESAYNGTRASGLLRKSIRILLSLM